MAKAPNAQAAAVRLERVSLAPKPPPQRFTLTSILRQRREGEKGIERECVYEGVCVWGEGGGGGLLNINFNLN